MQFTGLAQKICRTDAYNASLLNDPAFQKQLKNAKEFAKYYIATHKNKLIQNGAVTEIHIPVVFHVAHTGGAVGSIYNPSDADLNAVINSLNLSFGNTFDQPATPGTFNSINTPIRFDLAQRSPTCTPTTGIDRVNLSSNALYVSNGVFGDVSGVPDATIKDLLRWPTGDYYNIYVVNKIDGADGTVGQYIAGYANFGFSPIPFDDDGMVILATQCNAASTTPTHEIGHALNLPHPFGNVGGPGACPSSTGNCAVDNDGICDTEPVEFDFDCNPTGNNPCTAAPWAGIQYNYMAYFSCTDRFTAGQTAVMINTMETNRTNLATSQATDPPPTSSAVSASCNPTVTNVNNNFGMGPISVELKDINNNTGSYADDLLPLDDNMCTHETELFLNQPPQALTVITDNLNNQRVRVYIDFNNNGIFNLPTEQVLSSQSTTGGIFYTHTSNVVIPATAVLNTPLRMRVLADFAGAAFPTPCAALLYGQGEDYRIVIRNAPLAVTWKYLKAKAVDNKAVQLEWATANEVDSKLFEIERSIDGVNYSAIGNKNASGNSDVNNYYYYTDTKPNNGTNYYRIKQISKNETYTYSAIATASITGQTEKLVFQIAPNPARSTFNFSIANGKILPYTMNFMDLSGRKVFSVNGVNSTTNQIAINALAKGIYICQLKFDNMESVQKLVIE
jgi:hypothetical protein